MARPSRGRGPPLIRRIGNSLKTARPNSSPANKAVRWNATIMPKVSANRASAFSAPSRVLQRVSWRAAMRAPLARIAVAIRIGSLRWSVPMKEWTLYVRTRVIDR